MTISKKTFYIFAGLLFSFFLIPFSSFAQTTGVNLSVSPDYVEIGESFTANVTSASYDLNNSTVQWFLNGNLLKSGKAETRFSEKVSSASSTVKAVVTTNSGEKIEVEKKIKSQTMDLLWEAVDSSSAPFYKGKTLGYRGGKYKIVAIPGMTSSSSQVSHDSILFEWQEDFSASLGSNGYGEDSFQYINGLTDLNNIVSVKVVGNGKSIDKTIVVPMEKYQKIVVYEQTARLGTLYNREANFFSSLTPSHTLVSHPYFFSENDISNNKMEYIWEINGQDFSKNKLQRSITISNPPNSLSSVNLYVSAKSKNGFFQKAVKDVSLFFASPSVNLN
jgi:hypothetical protein